MHPLVDLLLVAFVGVYAYRGYRRGIVREAFDLGGFVLGAVLALRLHAYAGAPFRWVGMGDGWASFLGGLILFVPVVVGAGFAANRVMRMPRFLFLPPRVNHVGGAALAAAWAFAFAVFFLVLLLVLPAPSVMPAVSRSLVGRTVLASGSPVYSSLESFAAGDARNLVIYLRQYFAQLQPTSTPPDERLSIRASDAINLAEGAERRVLDLVNRERSERGLALLRLNRPIREVARSHSADMYRRGYFAHVNADGLDPFDRIRAASINFSFAGENLALAPTIELVHQGLMNSPRHRDNILKEEFTHVGIGVYVGPSGMMVTQNFCSDCSA